MVSRRTRVASWIFRRDHPSRPNAMICCFFSSFKTFAMLREATYPPAVVNVLDVSSESMAAFQVFMYGRFWVFTEALVTPANVADGTVLPELLHGEETRVWGDQAYRGQREVIHECAPHAQDCTTRDRSVISFSEPTSARHLTMVIYMLPLMRGRDPRIPRARRS